MTADEVVCSEMSECMKRLASPAEPGEKLKAIYGRVAVKTGLTYGQVKRLWKREWKVVPASVADAIREKVADHERRLDAEQEILRKRFWALNNASHDPEFYQRRTAASDQTADDMD